MAECKTCGEEFKPRAAEPNCMACVDKAAKERFERQAEERRIAREKKKLRPKMNRRRKKGLEANKVAREKAKEQLLEEHRQKIVESKEATEVNVVQRELAARALAKKHLLAFIMRNKSDYLPGWVHKDICKRLEKFSEDVIAGKRPRLMIQMPPRHGKSEIASVNFPAWFLGNYPDKEIIATSYAASLAMEFSRKVRAIMQEDGFKSVFPAANLDKDNMNAEGWRLTKKGGYTPAGVGGPITGKGAHILIIDDPVKNAEEADSMTDREAKKAWYQTTAYTRLAPGGGVLIIQTRWHDDDLSGWQEREMEEGGDQWEIVRYPMEAEEDETYRRKGDPLHPERYDAEAMAAIKRAVGPRTWAALYQQRPTTDAGSYFKREMFHWYQGPPPRGMPTYAAFDFAIGKNERNDWTVGITVGVDREDNLWVLDMRRGRWDAHEIVEQILQVHGKYTPEVIGLERGQISMAIGPYLDKRIAEERAYTLNTRDLPTGRRDKQARARAIQGRMAQGKVRFPKDAPWIDDLVNEMLAFPDGKHDDTVDALAWIGLMLQDMTVPAQQLVKHEHGWRKRLNQFIPGSGRRRSAMTA